MKDSAEFMSKTVVSESQFYSFREDPYMVTYEKQPVSNLSLFEVKVIIVHHNFLLKNLFALK